MLMGSNFPLKIDTGESLEERIVRHKKKTLISFSNHNIVSEKFICLDTKDRPVNCYSFSQEMSHSMFCKWLKENEPGQSLGNIFHLLAWHEAFSMQVMVHETILAPGTFWYRDPTWFFNKVIEYMPAIVIIGDRIGLDIRPRIDTLRIDKMEEAMYPANTGWITYPNDK